jgi:hypothetical protein
MVLLLLDFLLPTPQCCHRCRNGLCHISCAALRPKVSRRLSIHTCCCCSRRCHLASQSQ